MIIPLRDNAPHDKLPWVTLAIIIANVLIFLAQLGAQGGAQAVIDAWGIQPARLDAGGMHNGLPVWATLLTATYLHFDVMHLIGNMLMLWLLGDAIEWLCGRWRFLLFYHLCGIAASVVTWQLGGDSTMAGAGASGALAGVMGAYLLMFPTASITCLVIGYYGGMRQISALWFIGLWIAQQVYMSAVALQGKEAGPYGVYAHAAGAVAGMALIWLLRTPGKSGGISNQ